MDTKTNLKSRLSFLPKTRTEQRIFNNSTELQKALADLKKIMDSSLDIICTIDGEGEFVTVSAACQKILGYTPGELIGKKFMTLVYKEDAEATIKAFEKIKNDIQVPRFKNRYLNKSGRVVPMLWSVNWDVNERVMYCVAKDVTETEEVEQLKRRSEENLQAIFENTSEGLILTDTRGVVKAFNNKAKDLILLNAEKVIKIDESIFDFVHESRKAKYKKDIPKMLAGQTLHNDYPIKNKKGETKWFYVTTSPVYSLGNVTGFCFTTVDITENKLARELLQDSESNLKAIIENTDTTIYSLDKDLRYITYNPTHKIKIKEIFGLDIKPGDHVYNFLEKIDPEEAGTWQQLYAKALDGETLKFEKEFFFRGNYSCICFAFFPIRSNQQVTGLSCFTCDITEKKLIANALKKSESRYRQIVETAQEGIWLIDEDNKTIFVNKRMCEILEYSDEEMIGKQNFYFTDDAGKSVALNSLSKRKNGVRENYETHLITKSGRLIWVTVSANPIFDDHANYKGTLGMVSDITEKKILQQQLMEEQVNKQKEVTRAVANAQEKERAEIGAELHDNVNQLLAASRLCLDHSLSERDHAPSVLKSREYISIAVEEIRKLSHALIGPNQNKPLGLIDSIENLISNISILKDIKTTFNHGMYDESESEAGLKLVIYRIIQEQVSNILKHANAGKVEIELKKENNDLVLIIKDNGNGFDTSVKRNGIGLINIKNRAAVYDGNVQLLSSPGNGCKMKIIFKSV